MSASRTQIPDPENPALAQAAMVAPESSSEAAATSAELALATTLVADTPAGAPGEPGLSAGLGASGASELPPGAMLGRYEILNILGQGGMGVVYAAHDADLERTVAIKLLRPSTGIGSSPSSVDRARLLHEARAMARLARHPNVIAVYEVASVAGRDFVVMEYVDGTSLDVWLRQPKSAPGNAEGRTWREVLAVFVQAGKGLAAAHAAGVTHRDFKPANVLIDKTGRVLVTDFGLARRSAETPENQGAGQEVGQEAGQAPGRRAGRMSKPARRTAPTLELTRTGMVLGTPAYMAPEQHQGQPADARSDLFSFCVALYEGLYGTWPFSGASVDALGQAKARGQVPRPATGSPVPARVWRALVRGLEPDPARRFGSMQELLTEFEAVLDPVRGRSARARWVRGGVLVLAAVTAPVVWLLASSRDQSASPPIPAACRGDGLAGIWDAEARAALGGVLGASPEALASASGSTLDQPEPLDLLRRHTPAQAMARIDAASQAWREAYALVCTNAVAAVQAAEPGVLGKPGTIGAPAALGEPGAPAEPAGPAPLVSASAQSFADRIACLDQQRERLAVTIMALGRAGGEVSWLAPWVLRELPEASRCLDAEPGEHVLVRFTHPADAHAAREPRAELLIAEAERERWQLAAARTRTEAVLAQARAMDHAPLVAEALLQLGLTFLRQEATQDAVTVLEEATLVAQEARHDRVLARALCAFAHATISGDLAQARDLARKAAAAAKGLPGDALVQLELDGLQARIAEADGDLRQARTLAGRTLAAYLRAGRPADAAEYVMILAQLAFMSSEDEPALARLDAMAARLGAVLEPANPVPLRLLEARAFWLSRLGRGNEARQLINQSRAFWSSADGRRLLAELALPTRPPGRELRGRVVDAAGSPVPGAEVAAAPMLLGDSHYQMAVSMLRSDRGLGVVYAVADEEGRFVLADVTMEQVAVGAESTGKRSMPVPVPAGSSGTDVVLTVLPTGSLRGQVTIPAPAPGERITVLAVPVSAGTTALAQVAVMPGADGRFFLHNLAPGRYMVHVGVSGARGRYAGLDSRRIQVASGQETRFELTPPEISADLEVIVRSTYGVSIPWVRALLVPGTARARSYGDMRKLPFRIDGVRIGDGTGDSRKTGADTDVRIHFAGVKPGRYTVCIAPLDGGLSSERLGRIIEHQDAILAHCKAVDVTRTPAEQRVVLEVAPMRPLLPK